ncbi:contactin-1-like [Pempheris klunzingeri]|uniref:contactin-1-like n=1 Tax=Pempheris klunzingeri TaxID=3127111 RepID=UPI00397FB750
MCSTSCPLTENPAAYIWYKNRQFLYQDWSPWYQQLVSSEEAATYSCAVRGYEDLRAPEVSVDSVTSSCFSVTYAKGRMCSYKQTSEDEPCSITYPTEVHVQQTPSEGYITLNCATSCPLTDPQTTYRWYQNGQLYTHVNSQHYLVSPSVNRLSCAVNGHEDLLSAQSCAEAQRCWSVNYVRRRICALRGSSVNISSEYSYTNSLPLRSKTWYKRKRNAKADAEELIQAAGRVQFNDEAKNQHILRIENLQRTDSAEYAFRLLTVEGTPRQSDLPGVTLVVTGLKVTFTPSSVVSEGQRVTVTCSTSCPLTHNTNYIWSLNGRPLNLQETQNKHLVLDPVGSQHAGNYVCAVETHKQLNISSYERTLIVEAMWKTTAIINAVRLIVALLIPIPLLVFHLWMRKTLTSTTAPNDKGERSTRYI